VDYEPVFRGFHSFILIPRKEEALEPL